MIGEKLKKLKALAERGIGGEKDNARAIFEKLCDKYKVSPDQVESTFDEVKTRWFKHKRGAINRKLLFQCIFKTKGSGHKNWTRGSKKSEIGTDCTVAEAMEIELNYSFYSNALDAEIERLYSMFVQKNDIFPPNCEETSSGKKVTYEDILLYQSIKKQTCTLQITPPKQGAQ